MRRRRYKAGKNILRGADVVGRPVAKHTPQTSARQRQQHRCEYTINSAPKRGRCTMRGAHICTPLHSTKHQRARCGYVWTKECESHTSRSAVMGELCDRRLFAVSIVATAAAAAAAECLATKWVATPTAGLPVCLRRHCPSSSGWQRILDTGAC